jgi:hypothetical protein
MPRTSWASAMGPLPAIAIGQDPGLMKSLLLLTFVGRIGPLSTAMFDRCRNRVTASLPVMSRVVYGWFRL